MSRNAITLPQHRRDRAENPQLGKKGRMCTLVPAPSVLDDPYWTPCQDTTAQHRFRLWEHSSERYHECACGKEW